MLNCVSVWRGRIAILVQQNFSQAAAKNGQLKVLKCWQGSGYELESLLGKVDIANVARNWHLEVVKYLRELGLWWDEDTCASAAAGGPQVAEMGQGKPMSMECQDMR